MTLQEAKDEIAKSKVKHTVGGINHYYRNWQDFEIDGQHHWQEISAAHDEAAELYADSKTKELQNRIDELEEKLDNIMPQDWE